MLYVHSKNKRADYDLPDYLLSEDDYSYADGMALQFAYRCVSSNVKKSLNSHTCILFTYISLHFRYDVVLLFNV